MIKLRVSHYILIISLTLSNGLEHVLHFVNHAQPFESPLHRSFPKRRSVDDTNQEHSYIKDATRDIQFIANHLKKQEVYEKVSDFRISSNRNYFVQRSRWSTNGDLWPWLSIGYFYYYFVSLAF